MPETPSDDLRSKLESSFLVTSLKTHGFHRLEPLSRTKGASEKSLRMSTAPGAPPKPRRGGPNPYLLLGIFVIGSASFFFITDKRQRDPRNADRNKPFANPLLPPRDSPRVEVDSRGKYTE